MIANKKILILLPAYNAARTLKKTIAAIPPGIADEIILTDDSSDDQTLAIAKSLGIKTFTHEKNLGYGANQKTCYAEALKTDAEIIVMLHPDYQYDPRVIPFAAGFIVNDICDIVIGSRIRSRKEALDSGMPVYKYISNRFLTVLGNLILGQNLGDFHSGFRVYKRRVLETINYAGNSDDFIFDFEFLAQAAFQGYRMGDIPIPARYFPEASSINFRRSLKYGVQNIWVMVKFILEKNRLSRFKLFSKNKTQ